MHTTDNQGTQHQAHDLDLSLHSPTQARAINPLISSSQLVCLGRRSRQDRVKSVGFRVGFRLRGRMLG
jgi:hypothetical protein